tara:strand:- start:665 stop:838 length:174 start_codon:yes stop_codon:yes gene_type:complete
MVDHERIKGWEREYLSDAFNVINKREREILEGSPLKSHEGMIYGRMYAEWKAHNEIP